MSRPRPARAPGGPIRFAAVGDVHGRVDAMARALAGLPGGGLDFVLQVGDFEPHRDEADLATMAAPTKYKRVGDFPAYAAGAKRLPWPVYFIGGNHEPYGLLDARPDGFEVAPGVHYLGRAGAVDVGGLRVVGLSGVYDEGAFARERRPVAESLRAATFFNERDVERALAFARADVLLLHDWPAGIVAPADRPSFARPGALDAEVGNDYARLLVEALRPRFALCGHLHRAYRAVVDHGGGEVTVVRCLASVAQGREAYALFNYDGRAVNELGVAGGGA